MGRKRNPARAQRRNAERAAAKGVTPAPKVSEARPMRRLGLTWLWQKKRITLQQRTAGQTYGVDYRLDAVSGMEPIGSHLAQAAASVGGSAGTRLHMPKAEFHAEARDRLNAARAALSFQTDLVLACDMICGREMTPREINPDQRQADRLEQSLRIALDILVRHYSEHRGLTKLQKRA